MNEQFLKEYEKEWLKVPHKTTWTKQEVQDELEHLQKHINEEDDEDIQEDMFNEILDLTMLLKHWEENNNEEK